MFTIHKPSSIPVPASTFAHAVTVEGATRWLLISGQTGAYPREDLIGDSSEQIQECFQRIFTILADANMEKTNIVKINVFLTRPEDVALYREIRDKSMDGHITASTMLIVSGLADPGWFVEIEAIAAA